MNCRYCDKPIEGRAPQARYHADCARVVRAQRSIRAAMENNNLWRSVADHARYPWTRTEDALVLNKSMSARDCALILKRSRVAVEKRRRVLARMKSG